jgi:hypothetical protein
MRFLIKCRACSAEAWVRGTDDPETNACEIDDSQEIDWSETPCIGPCEHEVYDIYNSEYDAPFPDDVI